MNIKIVLDPDDYAESSSQFEKRIGNLDEIENDFRKLQAYSVSNGADIEQNKLFAEENSKANINDNYSPIQWRSSPKHQYGNEDFYFNSLLVEKSTDNTNTFFNSNGQETETSHDERIYIPAKYCCRINGFITCKACIYVMLFLVILIIFLFLVFALYLLKNHYFDPKYTNRILD